MRQPLKIDIDREFALAVKQAGGEVLDETLPANRDFKNADYIFRDESVIVELKRLNENKADDPDFRAKLSVAYCQLAREGLVPNVSGPCKVKIVERIAAERFLDVYKSRLLPHVKKANKQIRETADRLRIENPKGILLLANDGDLAFEFDIVLCALSRLLNRAAFHSIDEVIYFTANVESSVPGCHPRTQLWAPLFNEGRQEISETFTKRLFDAWIKRVSAVKGEPISTFISEAKDDSDASFVKLNAARPIKLTFK